jgi:hypothetical protein
MAVPVRLRHGRPPTAARSSRTHGCVIRMHSKTYAATDKVGGFHARRFTSAAPWSTLEYPRPPRSTLGYRRVPSSTLCVAPRSRLDFVGLAHSAPSRRPPSPPPSCTPPARPLPLR